MIPKRTYYLKPNGNDKNDGLTDLSAKATWNEVFNLVRLGDSVVVKFGDYEDFKITPAPGGFTISYSN